MKNIFLSIIFLVTLFIPVSANATVTAGYEQKVNWIATYPIVSIDNNPTAQEVKSIFVCKIPLGTQNLMQMPYFAAG